jgi:hypothetical protein
VESREACARCWVCEKELAAAEAAERLEAQLAAGRAQLAAVAVAGLDADPQASALARLIGAEEATIRTGGFGALVHAGVRGHSIYPPPPSAPGHAPGQANTARRRNAAPSVVGYAIEHRIQTGP